MKDDKAFLKHILNEIEFVVSKTKGRDVRFILEDDTLQRALLRSLEIIGEAVKNVSKDFKSKHADIHWKEMAGLRDKLIHFYFGVDWNIVWDVIENKIPKIKKQLEKLI